MARAGLNRFHVQQARNALRARGVNPSIDAIRIELGNTGSKTTIHRYVKELEAEESTQLDDEGLLSSALKEMIGRMAARLQEEANQRVEDAKTEYLAKKSDLLAQLHESQAKNTELSEIKKELLSQLAAERTDHAATKEMLKHTQIKAERLEQTVIGLNAQLSDNQHHLASLEEKHRNARDALEHFRTASKDQREQELQRHEHQVQQLQAELRQLSQTLSIKQTDITQLNKDNARLLTELSEIKKQLRNNENQLQLLASEKHNLAESLLIKTTQLIEFEREKVDAEHQISELRAQLKLLETSSHSMQIELVTAKTELTVKSQLFDSLSHHLRAQ